MGRNTGASESHRPVWPSRLEQLHRHLVNAELVSLDNWLRHPLRSLGRLIPLRAKEGINRAVGRPIFDLSFYLKFQVQSVLVTDTLVPLLRYIPPRPQRRRIALVTPHLGPGGAESVLLELAGAIDRRGMKYFCWLRNRRIRAGGRVGKKWWTTFMIWRTWCLPSGWLPRCALSRPIGNSTNSSSRIRWQPTAPCPICGANFRR